MKIVITRRIFSDLLAGLLPQIQCTHNEADQVWSAEELAQQAADAQVLVTTLTERVDAALLERCPQLKLVANIAVGTNNIDVEACTRRRIWVSNTPDVLTEATADHAFALLLACARRVTESERYLRAGKWQQWSLDMLLGQDVHHKTLGMIGMGRIGQAVAQRARGFGMRVCYHNRQAVSGSSEVWCSKEELLRQADFVVLTLPYSAATHHMIGAAELALMKPTAILINVARGGVVDDAALIQALQQKQIAGAGLDVFENEPHFNPAFLSLDNVVLTPHIGSATHATRRAMAQLALDNVADLLAGQTPRTAINQLA